MDAGGAGRIAFNAGPDFSQLDYLFVRFVFLKSRDSPPKYRGFFVNSKKLLDMGVTPTCIMWAKGGEGMGYTVKWVKDHLGITRDMLRYYEKEKLLVGNPNGEYRDYSNADIERIWGIKLLISIGFTAKEVYALMHDPSFDFETAIELKVKEGERKLEEGRAALEFAKTIKLTGLIPTSANIGSVRFDDFLRYVRENWNLYDDPYYSSVMKISDTPIPKQPREWSSEDYETLSVVLENTEEIAQVYTLHGYYQALATMQDLGCSSEVVQRVVSLIHKSLQECNTKANEKITPQFIAKSMTPFFLYGDVAKHYEQIYGKAACLFIAQSLAYYGGMKIEDLQGGCV